MNEREILNEIADKLSSFGAVALEYNGTPFVGIKNPFSNNNAVFTVSEGEIALEFTYQKARFSLDDLTSAVSYAKRLFNGEICAVEFFITDKSIFGGTRNTDGAKFKSAEELANWYSNGHKPIADNLLNAFFKNDAVSVKISSWNGNVDRDIQILFDGEKFSLIER